MNIKGDTKVGQIAASGSAATRVLEEAGVDYCCGGHQSLHDACAQAGVPEEEILKRLRENKSALGPQDANWASAPLSSLTEHIRAQHHTYVRETIRRIEPLLAKVKARHGANHPEITEIERLFAEISRDMIMHMQKEEQILFPYIEALERASNGRGSIEPPFFQTIRNPVHAMMREHDAAGDLVRQVRQASADYAPPQDACASFQSLYSELQAFETDLHQHVHLENNILFPRAVDIESALNLY
jgi:regulator of cell morphogenesis and NO signaling